MNNRRTVNHSPISKLASRWAKFKANPVLRLLLTYVKEQKRYMAVATVCSVGVALTSLAVLKPLKMIIDMGDPGLRHRNIAHDVHIITIASLWIVVAYSVRWIFAYGQTVLFAEAGQRCALRLRQDIYEHLQNLPLSFFNRQRTGALMSTMTNDVPILQSA